jgi:hypothetical protein
MSVKRVSFASKTVRDAAAETWVLEGNAGGEIARTKAEQFTARLTLDVTPDLRARIKVAAFRDGVTVADRLRELLEREFRREPGS